MEPSSAISNLGLNGKYPNGPIKKAHLFAQAAHKGQKRKYTGDDYIIHPEAVANIVSTVTDDEEVIAAPMLHDVVEDTSTTLEDLALVFGDRVAQLVSEVTDVSRPEDGNRVARKALDREHLAGASEEGQTIKLADLLDNSRTITEHDPKFAKVYMREKRELLGVLVNGHQWLRIQARQVLANYFRSET